MNSSSLLIAAWRLSSPAFAILAGIALTVASAGPSRAGPSVASVASAASAASEPASAKGDAESERLSKAIAAVVKLKTRALPNARSLNSLGAEREGSAIVIGPNNLLLTIGYLIVEAETVEVENHEGKLIPATVVAYDHGTGFGLVRALAPVGVTPIELGSSSRITPADSAIFASAGGIDSASSTTLVAKRRFAGYWEYMIDDALFTSPPRFDHSGAALIDRSGKLVGVGSLIVADATPGSGAAGGRGKLPGNMFVPIDLLKPIMDEMIKTGSSKLGKRPWLGITSQEMQGRVFVQRVQTESPAERAGIEQGDILLAVGPDKVSTLEDFYSILWKNRQPGDEVTLTMLQGSEIRKIVVKSIDRTQYARSRSSI